MPPNKHPGLREIREISVSPSQFHPSDICNLFAAACEYKGARHHKCRGSKVKIEYFTIMKYFTRILATLLLAAPAFAGPIQRQEVAADAKWLLHFDVDKLRSTPEGDYLVKELADRILDEPKAALKREADFDLDFTKANSITAYGDYSSNAVLLVKTDLDIEKLVDAALAQMVKSNNILSWPVVDKSVRDGILTYTFPDHASLWIRPDKIVLFSKLASSTEKANDVLAGRSANLTSSPTFSDFPDGQKTFFFFGAAEGFNSFPDLNPPTGTNNPKAKILKLTESGRVVIGQDADQVFVNFALKAKTPQVVTQMQQVIQGMIALASLTASENDDVQLLTDSAKVSATGNIVSLNLNFPADKALLILSTQLDRRDQEREIRAQTNAPPKTTDK
jgi:hypothetical protein